MTASAWPDFYVIGAGKSGTTSLYEVLRHHRQIYIPARKEPNYFSRGKYAPNYPHLSTEAYLSLYRHAREDQLKGDFSTSYFLCADTPARIRQRNASARFIVILRDPVARAFSDYLMLSRREGLVRRDFITEITGELLRLRAGIVKWPFLVKTGLYATNVAAYLRHFSRDRFLVLSLNELKASPQSVYQRVHDFLGIEFHPIEQRRLRARFNPSSEMRSAQLQKLLYGNSVSRLIARLTPERSRRTLDLFRQRILYRAVEKPRMPQEAWPLLRPVFEDELQRLPSLIDFDVNPLMERWPGCQGGREEKKESEAVLKPG